MSPSPGTRRVRSIPANFETTPIFVGNNEGEIFLFHVSAGIRTGAWELLTVCDLVPAEFHLKLAGRLVKLVYVPQ